MILLLLGTTMVLETTVFRFDEGYVELWYQLPLACLVDTEQLLGPEDTVSEMYSYDFDIYNVDGSDSAFQQGEKNVIATVGEEGDNIVDYIPLSLYPGRFKYTLNIKARGILVQTGGVIDLPPVEEWLTGSDVVIGRLGFGNFVFRGVDFLPAIPAAFDEYEHLFSYLELYDLVPDSLDYHVTYRVCDDRGGIVMEQTKSVLKHDHMQVDTHSLILAPLIEGAYEYVLTVLDPSSQSSVTRKSWFSVRTGEGISGEEFYEEIRYLVSEDEYRRYQRLNETQRKIFLKDFWSRHDYFQFEKRMIEADVKFTAGVLPGRDSERGRLYIRIGPPDEIEVMSVENWARPFEVWHYYGKNDLVFSDIKNDHNPRLVKVLKPGELTKLIATGFRDGTREEEWLSDIAPGTYNWQEDVEGVME